MCTVCNRYSMRPSVLRKYTGTSTRASCHVYCIKHEDFSCYNVFYITTIPYLPCNINRKELYDFYYTAITLTTGYKNLYPLLYRQGRWRQSVHWDRWCISKVAGLVRVSRGGGQRENQCFGHAQAYKGILGSQIQRIQENCSGTHILYVRLVCLR